MILTGVSEEMMKERLSVLRGKGQLTLPAEIREALGVQEGDKVAFVVEEGRVELRRRGSVVAASAGAFKNRGPVLTAEELRAEAERAIAETTVERSEA